MLRVFGGAALPGGRALALAHTLAVFSLDDELVLDAAAHLAKAAIDHFPASLPTGKRLWWQTNSYNSQKLTWVSLIPGEYREQRPTGPDDIIRELPATTGVITQRHELDAAVSNYKGSRQLVSVSEQMKLQIAQLRLSHPATTNPKLPPDVEQEIKTIFQQPSTAYQGLIDRLYSEYLYSHRCTVSYITPIICLLQLQSAFHAHMGQNWLSDPQGYLLSYVGHISRDATHGSNAQAIATEICNTEFRSARSLVTKALSGKMDDLAKGLFEAYHLFQLVWMIDKAFQISAAPLPGLEFTSILAEEAMVCTKTGIVASARSMFEEPEEHARELLRRTGGAREFAILRREARTKSSDILPQYTRNFSNVVAAQALTLLPEEQVIRSGIQELVALLATGPVSASFERGWINLALVNAYRAVGDESAQRSAATRFSAELMMNSCNCPG